MTAVFTPSTTARGIHDALAPVLSGIAGETSGARSRLAAVTGGANPQASPLAGGAAGAGALRVQLEALMASGGHMLAVHPYIHPVGDRRGDYSYLTPADCVAALAAKLTDAEDPPDPDRRAAVVVLVHALDHGPFAALLGAFNAVFPVTELQLAQRRARALATLEQDKFMVATAPKEPRWTTNTPSRHGLPCRLDTALGAQLAQSDGYDAENMTPEAELSALLSAREEHAAAIEQAWTDVCAGLAGEAGVGWYLEGDAENMARQLMAGSVPVAAYKCTALVCWIGLPERVAILREVFGL